MSVPGVHAFEQTQDLCERSRSAALTVPPPRGRRRSTSGFSCQECGHKFRTVKAAERAMFGAAGCPKCGGSDIDLSAQAANDQSQASRPPASAEAPAAVVQEVSATVAGAPTLAIARKCERCDGKGFVVRNVSCSGGYNRGDEYECESCCQLGRVVTLGAVPALDEVVKRLRALVAEDNACGQGPSIEPAIADELVLLAEAVEQEDRAADKRESELTAYLATLDDDLETERARYEAVRPAIRAMELQVQLADKERDEAKAEASHLRLELEGANASIAELQAQMDAVERRLADRLQKLSDDGNAGRRPS